MISLGCDKNLTDSEKIIGGLINNNHEITDEASEAEVIVINTCCFIHDAKQESIEAILEAAENKKTGKLKYLLVTGCLATRYTDEILEAIPEVDCVLSASAQDALFEVINKLEAGETVSGKLVKDPDNDPDLGKSRVFSNLKNYAYLKIAEGCNKHCTYCVIPSIKGNYRSRRFEDILEEAKLIADNGKNEILVIAQETTVYGTDLYGKKRLGELLNAISEIEGIEWIRVLYCYPEEIDDSLIEAMKINPKICKYIDMPIQHASDTVLKRMGRRTNYAEITSLINKLRAEIPGIAIRTSLITGFPGETEEEHAELVKFVSDMKLDRVGVFTYSREENTPAYKMKPQIKKAIKEKRRKELMLIQQQNVFTKNEELVGNVEDIIIDGKLPEEDVYIGRTYRDAPDIDGYCFVKADREIISGSIIKCVIKAANGYDLLAEEVE